jgi:hypothetical protein
MASAVVEGGVWMAIASYSGDEQMANNKFDDFTISENDLFFFEEENNKNKIQKLTSHLKEQLKINDLLKHIQYIPTMTQFLCSTPKTSWTLPIMTMQELQL